MLADHVFGGTHERFFVHRVEIVVDITGQKRWTNSAAINPVAIGFGLGGMPRVKSAAYNLYGIHAYGRRQSVIERDDQVAFRYRRFQADGSDLSERVNSGVRAPRALGQ